MLFLGTNIQAYHPFTHMSCKYHQKKFILLKNTFTGNFLKISTAVNILVKDVPCAKLLYC